MLRPKRNDKPILLNLPAQRGVALMALDAEMRVLRSPF
jgi:hypothetical protein